MKKVIAIIITSVILFSITGICFKVYDAKLNNISHEVTLTKCVDGDTAYFKYLGEEKSYRFLAINTPEINTKMGKEASNYTCNVLKNAKNIEIKYDEYGYKQDKYNRNLVWVFIDGELIQEKLLKEGYAKIKYVYANYNYLNELYKVQEDAIDNKKGIWYNYKEKVYNNYYTITLNYNNERKEVKILENEILKDIENPTKIGCRFLGWNNGSYLFDLSTKIKKEYNLIAAFDCEEEK